MSIEEQEDVMETFFHKDVKNVKYHFRNANCWKCCGGEHCASNRKVAGRKGFIHNNTKTKINK